MGVMSISQKQNFGLLSEMPGNQEYHDRPRHDFLVNAYKNSTIRTPKSSSTAIPFFSPAAPLYPTTLALPSFTRGTRGGEVRSRSTSICAARSLRHLGCHCPQDLYPPQPSIHQGPTPTPWCARGHHSG